MSLAARRWAVGAFGMIAVLTVVPVGLSGPARAEDGEWQVHRWSVEPGDAVAGEVWTITGTISPPMPGDVITDLALTLTRVEESDDCPSPTYNLHVRDGDGMGGDGEGGATTTSSTTATTGPTTTTSPPPPGEAERYRFRFDVVPTCNGHYQLHLVGTADRLGPVPDDVSDPLPMGDWNDPENAVAVSLRPPDVASTQAAVGSNRAVSVVWQPPTAYASKLPPDFVGYGVDYSPDGGTTWKNGALADPTAHTASFALGANDPAGDYQVRVRGVRRNADGTLEPALVASGGSTAIATVAVGAPPAVATPTPPTTRSRGSGGRGVPAGGRGPTTTIDEGYEETLDYSDLEEGDADATLPDDAASFLDFVGDSPGSAILVPFAIAECLAVWAFHLRLLAKRLEAPTPATAPILVDTTRSGRTR